MSHHVHDVVGACHHDSSAPAPRGTSTGPSGSAHGGCVPTYRTQTHARLSLLPPSSPSMPSTTEVRRRSQPWSRSHSRRRAMAKRGPVEPYHNHSGAGNNMCVARATARLEWPHVGRKTTRRTPQDHLFPACCAHRRHSQTCCLLEARGWPGAESADARQLSRRHVCTPQERLRDADAWVGQDPVCAPPRRY